MTTTHRRCSMSTGGPTVAAMHILLALSALLLSWPGGVSAQTVDSGKVAPPVKTVHGTSILDYINGAGQQTNDYSLAKFSGFINSTSSILPTPIIPALSGAGPCSVFAFTDAAVDAAQAQGLLADPASIAEYLTYHVVINQTVAYTNRTLPSRIVYETALSQEGIGLDNLGYGKNQSVVVLINQYSSVAVSAGNSAALVIDIINLDNGILFVIKSVLTPPTTLITTIKTYLKLNKYAQLITDVGLSDSLALLKGITVFIPVDDGLSTFFTDQPSAGASTTTKSAAVEFHILAGVYYAAQLRSLAPGTQLQTYLTGQTITISNPGNLVFSSPSDPNPSNPRNMTVISYDNLFDAGVIHITNTFLVPNFAPLPKTLPAPTQITPPGAYVPQPSGIGGPGNQSGKDFPLGALLGGLLGGIAFLALVVTLFFVVKRRQKIVEKYGDVEKDLGVAGLPPPSFNHEDPVELETYGDNDADDDEDDDEGQAEGGKVTKEDARRERERIMEMRRNRWSGGVDYNKNSKNKSNRNSASTAPHLVATGNDKRSSIISDLANSSHRVSWLQPPTDASSSSKKNRMSTISTSSVRTIEDQRKEVIRNSWWANTGVSGAPIEDPAVAEAQARREAARSSWLGPPNLDLENTEAAKRLSVVGSVDKRWSARRSMNGSVASASQQQKRRSETRSVGSETDPIDGPSFAVTPPTIDRRKEGGDGEGESSALAFVVGDQRG